MTIVALTVAFGLALVKIIVHPRKPRDHEPRALNLVLALPVPKCCASCCPSGHHRGTMPHQYCVGCVCSGRCGHPVRERGEWPSPPPWEADPARERPAPTSMPGPGERRRG